MTTVIAVETDDGTLWWSLHQLTSVSSLEEPFVVECVALGLVEVSGDPHDWRFNADTRLRLERAWRLHRDLEVHLSALPLVLELLDETRALRTEAAMLRSRLRHWEI